MTLPPALPEGVPARRPPFRPRPRSRRAPGDVRPRVSERLGRWQFLPERPVGPWGRRVEEYLALRRGLGFRLRSAGEELALFGRWADARGLRAPLTTEACVAWARSSPRGSRAYAAFRLGALRPFARHLVPLQLGTQVPPPGLLGRAFGRATPHIYSDAEVAQLLEATSLLAGADGRDSLRPDTYRALFGLLASMGLRVREALSLRRSAVDFEAGVLTVDSGKAGVGRRLPLHASALEALAHYCRRRESHYRRPGWPLPDALFITDKRRSALRYADVTIAFRGLRRQLGWETRFEVAPRLYDLRHTFAVRHLLHWVEAGLEVDALLPRLSTFMGHVSPASTYWYFSSVPALTQAASLRFSRFVAAGRRARPPRE